MKEKIIKFKLPESIEFPQVIFEDAKSLEGVKKAIADSGFIAVQQKDVIANRIMDTEEISEIRAEYGEIAETDLPSLHEELGALEAKYKADKKILEGQISALNTKFKDLVGFAKRGIRDFDLDYEKTFCISVMKHYLFYTWVNGRFELALVQEIPNHKGLDIFNSIEKNKEVFESLGYELPEIKIEDSRTNLRRFTHNDSNYEVWEENGIINVKIYWKEGFHDEATDDIVEIDHTEIVKYVSDNYPYADIDPYFNEQTEASERETDEIPEEPEE
jgi:hypothetical protein